MTDFTERDSGLVVPKEQSAKPPRNWGALEVQCPEVRAELQVMFQRMLAAGYCKDWGMTADPQGSHVRKELVLLLAHLFLGDDFTYEELC